MADNNAIQSMIDVMWSDLKSHGWRFSSLGDPLGYHEWLLSKHLRDRDYLVIIISGLRIAAHIAPLDPAANSVLLLPFQPMPFHLASGAHLWSIVLDGPDNVSAMRSRSCLLNFCLNAEFRNTSQLLNVWKLCHDAREWCGQINPTVDVIQGRFQDVWPNLLSSLKLIEYEYIALDRAPMLAADAGRIRLFQIT
jgi:hypothetical protein